MSPGLLVVAITLAAWGVGYYRQRQVQAARRAAAGYIRAFLVGTGETGAEIAGAAMHELQRRGFVRSSLKARHSTEQMALSALGLAMVALFVRGAYAAPGGGSNSAGHEMFAIWCRCMKGMTDGGYYTPVVAARNRTGMQAKLAEQGCDFS